MHVSMMKPEAALAKAILLNTHGKELFTALDCFVSAHLLRHVVNATIACKTLKVIACEPSSWKESFPH